MRKKLRNYVGEKSPSDAGRQVYQALQPSAQEVAHHCATSCALFFQLIFAKKTSPAFEKNYLNHLIYIALIISGTVLDNSQAPTGRYRLPGTLTF
ncbi:hypothetical protein ACFS4T_13395 [Pseudomonas lini]